MLWPFVGRDTEMDHVLGQLREGRRGGAVVLGPVGVGKTRFITEVASRLEADGHPVVRIQGTSTAQPIPFGATAALLPDPTMPATGQHDLIAAAARALATKAQNRRRVVLAVDDAPLLDPASLTLCHTALTGEHCLLLASVRNEPGIPDVVVRWWLDDLCVRVDLGPLSEEETDRLLEAVPGAPSDETSRSRIWRLSQGYPLYVRELLATDDDQVPSPRLADLAANRMASISSDGRRLLHAITMGEPLDVSFLDTHASHEVAADLERRGLIELREGTLTFVHPLYREIVAAQMSALERKVTCTALIEWVEGREGLDSADELRAAVWALEGEVAMDARACARGARAALTHFDPALGLRLADASLSVGPTFEGYLARGDALEMLGHADAEEALRRALHEATTPEERLIGVLTLARHLVMSERRHDEARALLEGSLASFDHPLARAALLDLQALNAFLSEDMRMVAEQTLAQLDDLEPGLPRSGMLLAASTALVHTGQLTRAEALIRLSRDELVGLPADVLVPLASTLIDSNEAWLEILRGRPGLGERLVRRAFRDAASANSTANLGVSAVTVADAQVAQGAISAARSTIDEAVRLLEQSDVVGILGGALHARARITCLGGDVHRGLELLPSLVAPESLNNRDHMHIGVAQSYVGLVNHLPDAEDRALTLFEVARRRTNDTPAVLMLNDMGRAGLAELAAPRFAELAARSDAPVTHALAAKARALARKAPDELDELAERCNALGWLLDAAECAAVAASLHAARGSVTSARRARARAGHLLGLCPGARTPLLETLVGGGLTAREREVASLARRMSNSAIAEQLHISVRTVENHLASVYQKLGITGRDELDARLDVG